LCNLSKRILVARNSLIRDCHSARIGAHALSRAKLPDTFEVGLSFALVAEYRATVGHLSLQETV
jgi:hypothetical protein